MILFLGGRGGSLSPPRFNMFTVGNMGVMICLGQGGLRSLSASSLAMFLFFQITYLYVLTAKFSMSDFIPVISIIVCLLKAWHPISLNHPFTKLARLC